MANTFVKIASATVGSGGAASIDFTSIPSTYTDLCVLLSLRGDAASSYNDSYVQFNNDTAGNYSMCRLYGTGSSTASDSLTSGANFGRVGSSVGSTSTSNTFANVMIYIPNYTGSTAKSFMSDGVTENNGSGAFAVLYADLWSGTAAISTVKIFGLSTNFVQYSTATLYGIKKS